MEISENVCIHRGPNSLTTGFGVSAYHCYNDEILQLKCLLSECNGAPSSFAVCNICLKRTQSRDIKLFDSNLEYFSTKRLVADTLVLSSVVPPDCVGIVGITRSGLIPASILATHLQLPLYELSLFDKIVFRRLSGGIRIVDTNLKNGPLFVVDDTVFDGHSMLLAKEYMKDKQAILSAVYVRPDKTDLVDYYVRDVSAPHFMEWNLYNSQYVCGFPNIPRYSGGIAFDFDGILCHDPISPNTDRSPNLDWLINAKPTSFIPRLNKIPLIITLRLERWREESEKWLNKYKISWDKLEMAKFETVEERDVKLPNIIIEHKAEIFTKSNCFMMIESDPRQAQLIHSYSKKPVLCPIEEKIYVT